MKRLRFRREPLEAGKLFMTRSQLERERVTEFAMHAVEKIVQTSIS